MTTSRDELHPIYLALFIIGGLCTGTGILNLWWSFGYADAPLTDNVSMHLDKIGNTALDNIGLLETADFSIPLVIVGVACLVIANATAWKETDGY